MPRWLDALRTYSARSSCFGAGKLPPLRLEYWVVIWGPVGGLQSPALRTHAHMHIHPQTRIFMPLNTDLFVLCARLYTFLLMFSSYIMWGFLTGGPAKFAPYGLSGGFTKKVDKRWRRLQTRYPLIDPCTNDGTCCFDHLDEETWEW